MGRSPPWKKSDAFDDHSNALADADAHGAERVLTALVLQFLQFLRLIRSFFNNDPPAYLLFSIILKHLAQIYFIT